MYGVLFYVIFKRVGDDFFEGKGLFFGCALFFGFVECFVFARYEGEFEVVEGAFDVESETSWEWAVGKRDVVVERVVEVVTSREYGLPFVHRDEEWIEVDFVAEDSHFDRDRVYYVFSFLVEHHIFGNSREGFAIE